MTKEELEKEAIQYAVNYPDHYGKGYKHKDLRIAYIAGAKPREKQIAELEKENAELERKLEQTEKDLADYQFNYPTIKELQKENAELKEKLGDVQMQKAGEKSDLVWKLKTANEQKTGQLTTAKKIISEFMEYKINEYDGSLEIHFEELKKQAEQFISEVEK